MYIYTHIHIYVHIYIHFSYMYEKCLCSPWYINRESKHFLIINQRHLQYQFLSYITPYGASATLCSVCWLIYDLLWLIPVLFLSWGALSYWLSSSHHHLCDFSPLVYSEFQCTLSVEYEWKVPLGAHTETSEAMELRWCCALRISEKVPLHHTREMWLEKMQRPPPELHSATIQGSSASLTKGTKCHYFHIPLLLSVLINYFISRPCVT